MHAGVCPVCRGVLNWLPSTAPDAETHHYAGGSEGLGAERTRKEFLKAVGGTWLALLGLAGCEPDPRVGAAASLARPGRTWAFRSRPDLSPPLVEVTTPARGTAPGYVFVAPKNGPDEGYPAQDGPMILDDEGRPVWFRPVAREAEDAMDFRAQSYRGEPVLTWWEGSHAGFGDGEYVIFDASYGEVARFRAGNGYKGDHHEFLITPQDTALILIYHEVPTDLSAFGGPKAGSVMDGIVQEIEIETGRVLFEWHSLEHVGIEESYYEPNPEQQEAYDYFHINSADAYDEGHLLISARRTSAAYKVDRKTGEVAWRLGGKRSDFEMGPGTEMAYQHDVRHHPEGVFTIFDNRGAAMNEQSRGLVLEVDEGAMTADLVHEYTLPDEPFGIFQGNVQVLPNGNAFVGWGSAPYFAEFTREGGLLYEVRFPHEVESYRAYRFPWKGRPEDAPAVAVEPGQDGRTTLYASWNGATEVASWEVLAGPDPEGLEPVGHVPRKGFETAIFLTTDEPYVAARAKDRSGQRLGTTEAVKRGG